MGSASGKQEKEGNSAMKININFLFHFFQNLTRIGSAPDPSQTWHNSNPNTSQTQIISDVLTPYQANRLHIQYHLSSIFPEEQVLSVMQMYPDESNPQNICAAILNMFPRI